MQSSDVMLQVTETTAVNLRNTTLSPAGYIQCRNETPTAAQLLHDLPPWATVLLTILAACVTISIGVYIEEIVFLRRHFNHGSRLNRTVWILALFPNYVITSFVAVIIPRAGPLCDLVSNVFFVTCVYQFFCLMEEYLGGELQMWKVLGDDRYFQLNSPPLCCCCLCLPKPPVNRRNYIRLSIIVGQVTVVRTLLAFIAAVLWADGHYTPGDMLPRSAFLYITILNVVSTLLAMWGLLIMKKTTRVDLEQRFALSGKILLIQLSVVSVVIVNICVGVLVTTGVIKCTSFYTSKSRASGISHCVVVMMMCLYGLLARHYYRRQCDAMEVDGGKDFTSINFENRAADVDHQTSPGHAHDAADAVH